MEATTTLKSVPHLNLLSVQQRKLERHLHSSRINSPLSTPKIERLEGETCLDYMKRIMSHGNVDYQSNNDYAASFIDFVVNNDYFSKIVAQMPTLHVCTSYDVTLFSQVLHTEDIDKIATFAMNMLYKSEMKIYQAMLLPLNIFSRPSQCSKHQAYEKAHQQLDNLYKKHYEIDRGISQKVKFYLDYILKNSLSLADSPLHDENVRQALEELDTLLQSQEGPSPQITIFLLLISTVIAKDQRLFVYRLLRQLLEDLKRSEKEVLLKLNICECFKSIDLEAMAQPDESPFLLDRLGKYNQFVFIELLEKNFAEEGLDEQLEEIKRWKAIGPYKEYYENIASLHRIQDGIQKTEKNIVQLAGDLLPPSINEITYLVHAGSLVARQPQDNRAWRQELKSNLSDWLNLQLDLLAHPLHEPDLDEKELDLPLKMSFQLKNSQGVLEHFDFCSDGVDYTVLKNNEQRFSGRSFSFSLPALLPHILNGASLEYMLHTAAQSKEQGFWNDWENTSPTAWSIYTQLIHPILTKVVHVILAHEETPQPVIVELGGGKGRLARLILEGLNSPCKYILLENNEKEIAEAHQNLGDLARVVQSNIVLDEQYYCDAEHTLAIGEETVDLSLASGVLTQTVLQNKEEALVVLQKVQKYLKPSGYLVLAGLARSFLNERDFTSAGFTVINKSLPQTDKDLYILQKKGM